MFIKGEVLNGTITLGFTVSGERGDWKVRIISPGGHTSENESVEKTWFPLYTEMLTAAIDNARRRRTGGIEANAGAGR
jgi:hypothetical protein